MYNFFSDSRRKLFIASRFIIGIPYALFFISVWGLQYCTNTLITYINPKSIKQIQTQNQNSSLIDSKPQKISISFSGAGFKSWYYLGVYKYIKNHIKTKHNTDDWHFTGASIGAFAAVITICEVDILLLKKLSDEFTTEYRDNNWNHFTTIALWIRNICEKILPDDAHIKASGRLHISITVLTPFPKNLIVNQFHSKNDLINAIIASQYIPLWSGPLPFIFRGKLCVDGGITNNQPVIDKHTICITTEKGSGHICPDILFSLKHIFVPGSQEFIDELIEHGFRDSSKYLQHIKTNKENID